MKHLKLLLICTLLISIIGCDQIESYIKLYDQQVKECASEYEKLRKFPKTAAYKDIKIEEFENDDPDKLISIHQAFKYKKSVL